MVPPVLRQFEADVAKPPERAPIPRSIRRIHGCVQVTDLAAATQPTTSQRREPLTLRPWLSEPLWNYQATSGGGRIGTGQCPPAVSVVAVAGSIVNGPARRFKMGEMSATPGRRAVRQPGLDELRLMTKVARLYHEKGIRQPQIAEQLRLSQARISRMLKQAEALGIVRTVITMPPGVHGDLEDRLQSLYGLRDVVVVDAADDDNIVSVLGSAAAAYLGATLTQGPVVGITSWSESVLAAVERMSSRTAPAVDRVVQLLGGLGAPSGQIHANRMVAQFADLWGATPILMPAPGLVSEPSVKEALLRDSSISNVMAVWDEITDAVVGIGGIEPSRQLLRSENGITSAERQELRALGAVGDICFRFYDADGALVESSLDERVMGISPTQFFRIPRRIGVAGGERKFDAVRAAAKGGWITVLITDLALAQRLAGAVDLEPSPGSPE